MIKKVTKVGNSAGIIFDQTFMNMARFGIGDEVNVEIHEGGTVTLTPIKKNRIEPEQGRAVAREFIEANKDLFESLS